jgi:hypothetical protein
MLGVDPLERVDALSGVHITMKVDIDDSEE